MNAISCILIVLTAFFITASVSYIIHKPHKPYKIYHVECSNSHSNKHEVTINDSLNTENQILAASSIDAFESNKNSNDQFNRWSNPKYDPTALNRQYIELNRSLITIGGSGLTEHHTNSLLTLLGHHERVRVKLATDKLDAFEIAKAFCSSNTLSDKVELLEVRKRGIMFGRNSAHMTGKMSAKSQKEIDVSMSKMINTAEFSRLIGEITAIEDNKERLAVLRKRIVPYVFTCDLLTSVLDTTTSVKTKLEMIELIGPRLTNPSDKLIDDLLPLFKYAEDSATIKKVVYARQQQLNLK